MLAPLMFWHFLTFAHLKCVCVCGGQTALSARYVGEDGPVVTLCTWPDHVGAVTSELVVAIGIVQFPLTHRFKQISEMHDEESHGPRYERCLQWTGRSADVMDLSCHCCSDVRESWVLTEPCRSLVSGLLDYIGQTWVCLPRSSILYNTILNVKRPFCLLFSSQRSRTTSTIHLLMSYFLQEGKPFAEV